jgi:hypothetical protein
MKLSTGILKILIFPITLFIGINKISAQAGIDSLANRELYNEIAKLDSIVFNAFNTRDVAKFGSLFTKDLEFYHDKGGLTNYEYTMNFMKDVAGNKNNDLKRELVKGSLEVYPIPGYGAMEIGAHTFCHLENGKQDCGTFKFVHIWKKENGAWKISRVVSYDH